MILEKIKNDLKEALKAGDEARVSTLRFLLSALHNREIALRQGFDGELSRTAQGENLTDEEVISVIQKQAKERRESIEAFKQGRRDDLVKKEEAELEILSKYLPQQMALEELEKIVTETIKEIGATGPGDFGRVMGALMPKVKGRADGQVVAELVKKSLNR